MQTNGGLSSLVQGHVTPSQSPFGSPSSSTSIPSTSSPRQNIRPEFDDRLVGNFPIKQESLPNIQGLDLELFRTRTGSKRPGTFRHHTLCFSNGEHNPLPKQT